MQVRGPIDRLSTISSAHKIKMMEATGFFGKTKQFVENAATGLTGLLTAGYVDLTGIKYNKEERAKIAEGGKDNINSAVHSAVSRKDKAMKRGLDKFADKYDIGHDPKDDDRDGPDV